MMTWESDLMPSIKKGILENPSYKLFQRLNLLISKDNTTEKESSELKALYENMTTYVQNLEESKNIIRKILDVIDNRYLDYKKEPYYTILKILNDKKFFDKLKALLIQESAFYNEGNFIDWKNILIERTDIK